MDTTGTIMKQLAFGLALNSSILSRCVGTKCPECIIKSNFYHPGSYRSRCEMSLRNDNLKTSSHL